MKKIAIVMFVVLLLPMIVAAQESTGNPHDRIHSNSVGRSAMDQALLADKVLQATVTAEFEELIKQYPQHMQDIRPVAQMHKELVALFRNGQNGTFGSYFYQGVLIKMEDIAAAVADIKEQSLRTKCMGILDQRYVFVPLGAKPASLKEISEFVARKINVLTGGYAQPKWGDFYDSFTGYCN